MNQDRIIQKNILLEELSKAEKPNKKWIDIEFLRHKINLKPNEFRTLIEELIVENLIESDTSAERISLTKLGHNYLIQNPEISEQNKYENLVFKALNAKKKIDSGFIDLAESIYEIHGYKLYKKEYKTFELFCEEKLGFSVKTIYVYLKIHELIKSFPKYFPKSRAVEFGQKKMRAITEGVSKIDKEFVDTRKRKGKIINLFNRVKPDMSANQIKDSIRQIINK